MTIDDIRSKTMRAIKSKNTMPELAVRRLIHSRGFRFRLHRKNLPGSPDLVFPSKLKVIFVHGCFWHGHDCPRGSRIPKTNAEYWTTKIKRNQTRDKENARALSKAGWESVVLWECEIKNTDNLTKKILEFLRD